MSEKLCLNDYGSFTWMWDQKFFIETDKGNYIWSDPGYGGDNTLRPYWGTYQDYLQDTGIPYGRDKGKHPIKAYCGEEVQILDKPWKKGEP